MASKPTKGSELLMLFFVTDRTFLMMLPFRIG